MNKINSLIALTFSLACLAPAAFAELPLPSGSERRPNLSLDPFERARDAVKRLPTAAPQEESREPARQPAQVQQAAPEPQRATRQPVDLAPVSAETESEPGQAFTQEIALTAEYFSLVSGGQPQDVDNPTPTSAIPVVAVYTAEVDTSAAGLWNDGTLFTSLIFYTASNSPSEILGDFHGLSGNDAGPDQTYQISEAWYQHHFEHGRASIQVGINDWNASFYVAEYANLFVNGAPSMGGVIGAVVAPSSYPQTAFGLRLHTELTERSYIQLGMYDATPGEVTEMVNLNWTKNDGVFSSVEAGIREGEPGESGYFKVAAGGWYLRKPVTEYVGTEEGEEVLLPDGSGSIAVNRGAFNEPGLTGAYILGETNIGEKLGIFFKAGYADPLYSRWSTFYSGGINYSGLIPGRVDDVFGAAIMHSRHSPNFLADNSDPDQQPYFLIGETTLEITYAAQINDWLMFQPTVEYVQQPAMSYINANSLVAGLRVQAVF